MKIEELGLMAIGFGIGMLASSWVWLRFVQSILRDWQDSNERWRQHCNKLNELWADAYTDDDLPEEEIAE